MARRRKTYEDDDGRTIVDMSGISAPSMMGNRPGAEQPAKAPETAQTPQQPPFTRGESWMYALGALKAALLIGLAFVVGLGLVTLLLMLIWRVF